MNRITTILAFMVLLVPSIAAAAEVTLLVPGAVQSIVIDMMKDYERRSGNAVKYIFDTACSITKRVTGGEHGDVVISTAGALANLAKSGQVVQGSIRDLGSMGVGVAVRKGALLPNIGDVASFKTSMLAANSIMYADPAKGGQSGLHVAKVIGLGQISEILANKDVVLVGPLPAAIQGLVKFSASVHSSAQHTRVAEETIEVLLSPSAKERFKQAGFN